MINEGFDESAEYQEPSSPAILHLDHDNSGYIGHDENDVAIRTQYQNLKPTATTTGKHGHPPQGDFKSYKVESGRDALEMENGNYMPAEAPYSRPFGFNRADSYKFGRDTAADTKHTEKDSSNRTCCLIVVIFLLVAAIIAGVVVALVFVFVSKLS